MGAVFLVLQLGLFALALTGSHNNSTDNGMVRPPAAVLVIGAGR